MKELFLTLEQILRAGRPAVLVTITASGGSSPRGAGARMLVTVEGLRAGTVGGGLLEHRCIQQARELLGGAGPVRQDFVTAIHQCFFQVADRDGAAVYLPKQIELDGQGGESIPLTWKSSTFGGLSSGKGINFLKGRLRDIIADTRHRLRAC